MSPAVLGLVRGLGTVVVFAVLSFFADAVYLAPLVGQPLAALIAGIVLQLEHSLQARGGGALFGLVK